MIFSYHVSWLRKRSKFSMLVNGAIGSVGVDKGSINKATARSDSA